LAIAGPKPIVVPIAYRSLAAAVAWSLPTAALAGICFPLAADIACLGLLVALRSQGQHRLAGLAALPVLLAAIPPRTPDSPTPQPGPAWLEGRVHDVVRAPLTGRNHVTFAGDVRVAFPGLVELLPGDQVRMLVRCRATTIPDVQPTMLAIPETMTVTPGDWSFRRGCAELRRAMERQMLRIVPGEHGPTLATLVLGRATRPDHELAAAHRATGLSHLLAVSGAHAAMLAFLLGMSSRGRHLGAGRTRTTFVLLILLLYGSIAGAEPPVLRAVVAYTLAAVAARLGRPFGIAQGLLVPAWITCLVEPGALLGASFLLSYAAVIGLAMALRDRKPETPVEWLFDGLRASFWATLLTAPLTLGFFGQLAPWTILLTPLCAPLVACMLLIGLIAATAALLAPALGDLFALPLHALTSSYTWIVHTADGLPGTPIPAWFQPPVWAIAATACVGAGFVYWRPRKTTLVFAIAAVCSLWFVCGGQTRPPSLELFAVGHGQSALLVSNQKQQVVIDCGSLQGGFRAARRLEASLTRRTIDLLIITHADQDHHNGVPILTERLTITRALLPATLAGSAVDQALREHGCEVQLIRAGEQRNVLPEVRVFAPDLPPIARDNDRSLWLKATVGTTRILFTGDAQELGIATALASGFVQATDVLVLPHHGRRNQNAPHLLARARPRTCLASATSIDGATLLGPLARRFDAELWTTGLHGTITLTATDHGEATVSVQVPSGF